MLACAEGDGVDHVPQVRFEAGGDVDGAQSSLKAGDFEAPRGKLLAELLLSDLAAVKFLARVEGAAVDGGDESIGNGLDGVVDIRVHAEDNLGGSG